MNWLQSIIYGFISGISEFLPISSGGHRQILLYLFGETESDPVRNLFIHAATLLALYFSMRNLFMQMRREQRMKRDRRRSHSSTRTVMDLELVRNAAVPMVVGMLVISFIFRKNVELPWVCLCLVINGLVLFLTERAIRGNKDAQSLSMFDSWLIGLASALSVFSGISRIGAGCSVAVLRGADRSKALTWSLLISVPALCTLIALDFFAIFAGTGIGFFANLGGYLLSALMAFFGSYLSIYLTRFVSARSGTLGFAYYSWGAALFAFIIYLVVA